jgi:hypothetical protein
MTVLVHKTYKTVHEEDCRWLAGTKADMNNYEKLDVSRLPPNARPCSWCAPPMKP